MKTNHCNNRISRAITSLAAIGTLAITQAATAQCVSTLPDGYEKGEISRTFYRIPYATGEDVTMNNDYFGHGGAMDMKGTASEPVIVAPADGTICFARDKYNDCGCSQNTSSPIAPCYNAMFILHDNGEISSLLHFKQGSIHDAFNVDPLDTDLNSLVGTPVSAGQPLGYEGDVGRTCSQDPNNPPRWGTCITQSQAAQLGPCGRHLHWSTRRVTTGELLEPMTCGIPYQIYEKGTTYTAGVCQAGSTCFIGPLTIPSTVLDGLGNAKVYQGTNSITASSFVVRTSASAVFHAANRITLLPGFHAGQGDSYFRAEIGYCNTTAPNP